MPAIPNHNALDIILEHLEMANGYAEQLIENDMLVEHEKSKPILNHIRDNTKLVWLLVDKYINLDDPTVARDVFRAYLHIDLRLTRLTDNPTLDRVQLFLTDITSLNDILKK